MLHDFWQLFVNGYKRRTMAASIFIISVVTALLEGVNIGLLVPLLEIIQSSSSERHWITDVVSNLFMAFGIPFHLRSLLIAFGVFVISMTTLKYWKMVLTGRLRVGFILWIRSRFMDNLIYADISYFHNERLGVMTDNITGQSLIAGTSVVDSIELLGTAVLVTTYLIGAFLISPM